MPEPRRPVGRGATGADPGSSAPQRLGLGVVPAVIRNGAVAVGDGVAIDAAVRTGVVGADVARQGAAAARTVAALARRDRPLRDLGEARRVDAACLTEP